MRGSSTTARFLRPLGVLLLVLLVDIPLAEADIYVNIPGLRGQATRTNYVGWIEASSVSLSATTPRGANASLTGTPSGSLSLTIEFSSVVSPLFQAQRDAKVASSAEIHLTAAFSDRHQTVSVISLSNVRVADIGVSYSGQGQAPLVQLQLAYERCEIAVTDFDPRGAKKGESRGPCAGSPAGSVR